MIDNKNLKSRKTVPPHNTDFSAKDVPLCLPYENVETPSSRTTTSIPTVNAVLPSTTSFVDLSTFPAAITTTLPGNDAENKEQIVQGSLSSLVIHLNFGCRHHKSLRHMYTTQAYI